MESLITASPDILGGKPCVRGTRISIEIILELMASGSTEREIQEAYPQLPPGSVTAALAYAAKALKNEVVWDLQLPA